MNFQALLQNRKPGVAPDELATLLSWATNGLPTTYVDLLRFSNGFEDWQTQSIVLWAAEDVPQANRDYEVAEYAPGLLLIGSDGGGEAVALDTRHSASPEHWRVVAVPFIGMGLEVCVELAPSFAQWA